MADIYARAQQATKATGIKHSVDHIFPLKHRHSCGLHVPWNLRVVTLADNVRKKNRLPSAEFYQLPTVKEPAE